MTQISWEGKSFFEVRAEAECALEVDESKRIKQFLSSIDILSQWRDNLTKACKKLLSAKGARGLTEDAIYDNVVDDALESFPEEARSELLKRIMGFLNSQLEDRM